MWSLVPYWGLSNAIIIQETTIWNSKDPLWWLTHICIHFPSTIKICYLLPNDLISSTNIDMFKQKYVGGLASVWQLYLGFIFLYLQVYLCQYSILYTEVMHSNIIIKSPYTVHNFLAVMKVTVRYVEVWKTGCQFCVNPYKCYSEEGWHFMWATGQVWVRCFEGL